MERELSDLKVISKKNPNLTTNSHDMEQDLLGKDIREERIVDLLRKCRSEEQIDALFEQYLIKDYKMRNTLLREAMGCVFIRNASIENPRLQRESLSLEEILERMYKTEKRCLLDDLGIFIE